MFHPIPGGSTQRIQFDEETIEVHLPPVGYVIDKVPDPKTGRPSEKLIKSEILFDDLPLVDKRWTKPKLPKNWDKWLEEEKANQFINPKYTSREADEFRAREWRRRINGVWIALGNDDKKPVEYVYLTGCHYFYLTWWDPGFEVKFRVVDTKTFYTLSWAEDNPKCTGVIQVVPRRTGKSTKAYVWYYDYPTYHRFAFGGLQAQKRDEAKEAFIEGVAGPFQRLPEFFRPIYDDSTELKTGLYLRRKVSTGKNAKLNFEKSTALEGWLTFKETSERAYDKKKLHRYIAEEPGKWIEANISQTYQRIKPTFYDSNYIIGKAYLPTTIEEMKDGGESFVKLMEDSLPSLMKVYDGYTKSGLIASVIPAYETFIFDGYGRSIVDDPPKNKIIKDEKGNIVTEGAKTQLLKRRKIVENDLALLTEEMRKYFWTWDEAKSVSSEFCHFNHMAVTKQLQHLRSLPKKPWIKGNLDWVKEKDGEVDFTRDDHKGRFKFSWLPDETGTGGQVDNGRKILNNVREEWDSENGRKLYYPKNDHLFAIGGDPIRNVKTDDPTASKAAFYAFRKYDASVDHGKTDHNNWQSHCFFVEYITRPEDPEIFHEDMIKLCRFLGCSVLAEDNVETFRQYFDMRGYGGFILYRGDFDDNALPGVNKEDGYAEKPLRSDEVVINNYVNHINMYFKYDIQRFPFETALEQCLKFRIAKHHMQDAVVGIGFTLIASKANKYKPEDETGKVPIEMQLFPMYQVEQTGESREVELHEFNWN